MRGDKMTRDELIQLLLVERKTILQVAVIADVHRNTVGKWVREYEIDITQWWRHQPLICNNCGHLIDPEGDLPEGKRKAMITKPKKFCDTCKVDIARTKNREKASRYRKKNREKYNEYLREYRKNKPVTSDKESNE
jgi:hypothetical protein